MVSSPIATKSNEFYSSPNVSNSGIDVGKISPLSTDTLTTEAHDSELDRSDFSAMSNTTKTIFLKHVNTENPLLCLKAYFIIGKMKDVEEDHIKERVCHKLSSLFIKSDLVKDEVIELPNELIKDQKFFIDWFQDDFLIFKEKQSKYKEEIIKILREENDINSVIKNSVDPKLATLWNKNFIKFLIHAYIKSSKFKKYLQSITGASKPLNDYSDSELRNLNISTNILNKVTKTLDNKLKFNINQISKLTNANSNFNDSVVEVLKFERDALKEADSAKKNYEDAIRNTIDISKKEMDAGNSGSKSFFNKKNLISAIVFFTVLTGLTWLIFPLFKKEQNVNKVDKEQDVCNEVEKLLLKNDKLDPKGGRMHGGYFWDPDKIGGMKAEKYYTDCNNTLIRNYFYRKYKFNDKK